MNKNVELKKILRDYNYLYESLKDVKEISEIAESEFREAMIASGDQEAMEALVPTKEDSEKLEEVKVAEEETINHNDVEFKKLFRKIVIKCHPDKISSDTSEKESSRLKNLYEDAVKANERYDWGLLLRVANHLELDYDFISDEQIQSIKKRNEELKVEIERYEKSMAYSWYSEKEEEARNNFLAFCLNIIKSSVKK